MRFAASSATSNFVWFLSLFSSLGSNPTFRGPLLLRAFSARCSEGSSVGSGSASSFLSLHPKRNPTDKIVDRRPNKYFLFFILFSLLVVVV